MSWGPESKVVMEGGFTSDPSKVASITVVLREMLSPQGTFI